MGAAAVSSATSMSAVELRAAAEEDTEADAEGGSNGRTSKVSGNATLLLITSSAHTQTHERDREREERKKEEKQHQ